MSDLKSKGFSGVVGPEIMLDVDKYVEFTTCEFNM